MEICITAHSWVLTMRKNWELEFLEATGWAVCCQVRDVYCESLTVARVMVTHFHKQPATFSSVKWSLLGKGCCVIHRYAAQLPALMQFGNCLRRLLNSSQSVHLRPLLHLAHFCAQTVLVSFWLSSKGLSDGTRPCRFLESVFRVLWYISYFYLAVRSWKIRDFTGSCMILNDKA